MLLIISEQKDLRLIDISKDDDLRVINGSLASSLFTVIDDLLAIDWIQMASDLFLGIGDLWIEQELDDEFPFSDYDTFHEWILSHHCLYKESISEITFDLLKTQFPRFTEESWDRFYNALIFLNTEGYFTKLSFSDRRALFYKLFPKVNFFSPFNQLCNDPIEMVSSSVFSSNLEMLVYDIINDLCINEEHCTEKAIFRFCSDLVNTFGIRRRMSKELYFDYTVDRFIEDYFSGPPFKEIPSEVYGHIYVLFQLLSSRDIGSILITEFRISERDRTRYGQEKLPISYFVDSDLRDRFRCKEYLYDCYAKYEILGIDIFNIDNEVNLTLLLGLYASCFSNLSFAKCNTCGHYFVRNINNKSDVQCKRCKEQVSRFLNVTQIQQQLRNIERNSDTAISRMNRDRERKGSSFYELINIPAEIIGRKEVCDLYKEMIKEYCRQIRSVILLLSQEHIATYYDLLDLYGHPELADQIEQEKKLLPVRSAQHGVLNYDFLKFYNDDLAKKPFFTAFEYLKEASADSSMYGKAVLRLQLTFAKMRSVFGSYGLNVDKFEELQKSFIAIINEVKEQLKP